MIQKTKALFLHLVRASVILFLLMPINSQAFETAKTLPQGVRNLNIRTVNTQIESKTDGSGNALPLAEPLKQDLTFEKIAHGDSPIKAKQLKAFLLINGFNEGQSVGTFAADLNGSLNVTAPIFAYGWTDDFSIAIAVPYYQAATSINVGFKANSTGQEFLNSLASPQNNQAGLAHEAGIKLNNAVSELNVQLDENGYGKLEDWQDSGIGDITLATKQRLINRPAFALATANGLVLPTGRVDDLDLLQDIGFGDGQTDFFSQWIFEQTLPSKINFAQHAKYTVQLPDSKNVRYVEEDEVIAVRSGVTRFKLGDKIDAGLSMTWTPDSGFVSGIGYNYFKKFGDIYRELPEYSKLILERDTVQTSHVAEFGIGYSTLPAYLRGDFAAPFEVKLSYLKQLRSANLPVTDLAQFDMNLFF